MAPAPADPLRLTPFERYMLLDAGVGGEMVIELALELRGRVERGPLHAALIAAAARHPLLSSVVVDDGGALRWEPAPGLTPQLTWDPEPPPAPLDVRRRPGLSARVEPGPALTTVRVHFHHVATDGLGAFLLLEDLLVAYHEQVTRQAVPWPSRVPAALTRRTELSQRSRGAIGLRAQLGAVTNAWRFALREPQRLGGPAGPDPDGWRVRLLRMEPETLAGLRQAARAQGVSFNDLLLRDLLLALGAALPPSSAPLRVMVPIDLRDERHAGMPAANLVSVEAVERSRDELRDPRALLASVARQTIGWRDGDAGQMVRALGPLLAVPGLLTASLRRDFAYGTLVCSNVGRVFAALPLPARDGRWCAGEAELTGVWGTPPVRRSTPASLGVAIYADQMLACLRHDPRRFPTPAAATLLHALEEALLRSCAG